MIIFLKFVKKLFGLLHILTQIELSEQQLE